MCTWQPSDLPSGLMFVCRSMTATIMLPSCQWCGWYNGRLYYTTVLFCNTVAVTADNGHDSGWAACCCIPSPACTTHPACLTLSTSRSHIWPFEDFSCKDSPRNERCYWCEGEVCQACGISRVQSLWKQIVHYIYLANGSDLDIVLLGRQSNRLPYMYWTDLDLCKFLQCNHCRVWNHVTMYIKCFMHFCSIA